MELKLSQPEFLVLQSPDGSTKVNVDIFEARRKLEEAQQQPTQELRWKMVLEYLAERLHMKPDSLAENMALEFYECIQRCVIKSLDDRKKKLDSIVVLVKENINANT